MDLQMPVMNGIDAILAIRCEFPGARIVILTTYGGDAQAVRALKAGAVGYLLKNMLREELVNTIRSIHSGQRRIPSEIAAGIAEHVAASSDELAALAIDGKTLCSTLAEHGRSIALLSLFDEKSGCVLSQLEVPHDTNEAKAALPILKTLALEGRVVTGDAMFAQSEICREIIDSGGDYLFVVKDNQAELKDAIAGDFLPGFSPRHTTQTPVATL